MAKANDVPQFGLLNGLKVLSCGQVTAEPHATSLMAEHGADVIHVENCKSPRDDAWLCNLIRSGEPQ